jgi:hypothetical protein
MGIAAGAILAGGAAQAFGQDQQLAGEAKTARENAYLARLAASDVERRAGQDAGRARTAGTQVIAEQRAAFGASGVDGSSGSPLALMADSRLMSELDALTIRNNAAREAWGLRTQARQLATRARQINDSRGPAALGTLLGAGGSAYAARTR